MSQLDTIMTTRGMPAFRRVLGDEVTYTPAGGAHVATWAIVAVGSAMVGQYGERLEVRTTAQLPKADVPDPQPGDSITIGATTYRVDQVTTVNNLFVEAVIR